MGTRVKDLLAVVTLLSAVILVSSCTPKVTPAPQATPAKSDRQNAVASLPTISPEEIAWQRVVEAAKQEGNLSVYTYWPGDTNLMLQNAFKARFGITVDMIVGKGATHMERLLTEKRTGKMVADTFFGNTPHVVNAQKADLTASLAELPVLREKDVWLVRPDVLSSDKQFLSVAFQSYPPMMNTKLLELAQAPRSYQDLLSPAWKGKMIITSPAANSVMYSMFVPLLNRGIVTMDFIKQLEKQELLFKVSAEASTLALAQGERSFMITGSDTVTNQYVVQGAPIKPVPLQEGTTVDVTPSGALIKGGPHPNAAMLFFDWLLTKEGQTVFHKSLSTKSIRKDVQDWTPEAARFSTNKLVNASLDDLQQEAKMFTDKVFPKLWGQ